ncbi:MAG: hypothetical protein ACM3OH_00615 [Bacillota bacterium]|jgi:hypothetical protein
MSTRGAVANRTLTIIAAGFLAFDGAALVLGGAVLGRVLLIIIGGCLILSSGLVFMYWNHHRRQAAEIASAREEVRSQARALRDLIQRN